MSEEKMPYVDPRFNYLGMYNWTNDLPLGQNARQKFIDVLEYFNTKRIANPQILEIGTYVGTSLIKIMELIPGSTGTVIDKWDDYIEYNSDNNPIDILNNMVRNNTEKVFRNNIQIAGLSDRVHILKGDSKNVLVNLLQVGKQYDLIYVDGSHTLLDSYVDIVLSWNLLKVNGILIIDDVCYNRETVLQSPYEGVIKFMGENRDQINVLQLSYRFFLEKKAYQKSDS